MRVVLGLAGLVVTLALVGLLAKKQLGGLPVPATSAGATSATPLQQSQQMQQQVRQAVEGAMQQARPLPEAE